MITTGGAMPEPVDDFLGPSDLVIFGKPEAGTPLMQGAPTAGIDLPLKALIWQDDAGGTWPS
jgi:uncharacterized protein (DUF302 family)